MMNRYLLFLKRSAVRFSTWLVTLLIVVLTLVFAKTVLPDKDNRTVMLYGTDEYAVSLAGRLTGKTDTPWIFAAASSAEEVTEAVKNGRAECGFIFADDLGDRILSGDTAECITYVRSPYTVKGNAAKEYVYAAILESYGMILVSNNADRIFPDGEAGFARAWQFYDSYAGNEKVFGAVTERIDRTGGSTIPGRTYPVHGMVGLLLFAQMLFAGAEGRFGHDRAYECALGRRERIAVSCIGKLAGVTLPGLAGLVMIRILEPVGSIVPEIMLYLAYILISVFWSEAVVRMAFREETVVCYCILACVTMMIAAPVIRESADLIPYVRYVRLLVPGGIYLTLLGML